MQIWNDRHGERTQAMKLPSVKLWRGEQACWAGTEWMGEEASEGYLGCRGLARGLACWPEEENASI